MNLESAALINAQKNVRVTPADIFGAYDKSVAGKTASLEAQVELIGALEPQLYDLFGTIFKRNPKLTKVTDRSVLTGDFNIVYDAKASLEVVSNVQKSVKSTLSVSSVYKMLRARTQHEIVAIRTPKGISISW